MTAQVITAACLPAAVLVWHIYRKDKYQPEPTSQLLKGFAWGILSALMAIVVATPFSLLPVDNGESGIMSCLYRAFVCAAIPEEFTKALCLYLFLRKNKYFDEYMDGIVYAVAVGMGFAAFENILYLFNNIDEWVKVAILRGILSVPGHFADAVLMGYFFSLWRINNDQKSFFLMLIAPIIAHGIFDFLVFYMGVSETAAVAILIIFALFLNRLRKHCSKLIESHLTEDKKIIDLNMTSEDND